jgi:hypothetical protein
MGKAYYAVGEYNAAIGIYENWFEIMKLMFGERFPSFHDFDSGDIYILLAQAYLAVDEQEKALTELFVGSIRQTQHQYQVHYTPIDAVENEVLCRFSKHAGVVHKDDLSGEPIYISIQAHKQSIGEAVLLDSKGAIPSHVYYNLPGQAYLTISFQNQSVCTTLPIAQWGVAIPLAQDYFTSKNKSTIYFNPNTGNISSIQQ